MLTATAAPVVRLDACELDVIRAAARCRANSNSAGADRLPGTESDRERAEVLGAAAEYAVSLYLDRSWRPCVADPAALNTDVGADGSGIEVRATKRPEGKLILRTGDRLDSAYWLVRADPASLAFTLAGWLPAGRDGMTGEFWHRGTDGRRTGFYAVPDDRLQPAESWWHRP